MDERLLRALTLRVHNAAKGDDASIAAARSALHVVNSVRRALYKWLVRRKREEYAFEKMLLVTVAFVAGIWYFLSYIEA